MRLGRDVIPVSAVRIGEEEERLVVEVLRSGHLTQGKVVEQLESAFADLCSCAHAVAVSSGTAALVAALRTLGVGPGQEVVTSPFTFVATVNAIIAVGATVRFADIGADFNIDVAAVRAAITSSCRAVLPVHLYGQAADMPGISQIAHESGLAVVEDAAQAHGATVGGKPVGSFGVGCFSLYATKNVFAGEGGMITTDDDELAGRLRILRNQGMREHYDYVMVGENLRLTDVHAAIALPQLHTLAERTESRRRHAARLQEGLRDVPGLIVPVEEPGRRHVWHQFTVRVTGDAPVTRAELIARLTAAGVGTAVHYPRAIIDHDVYRGHPLVAGSDVPNARLAAEQVLSLPVHPWLSTGDLDHIVESVREALHA
jgi:perosamine synthetase